MKKETKKIVENAFQNISKYGEKVGANSMGYNMQLDLIKASITDEVEVQQAIEKLVENLMIAKLWRISRVSFTSKELYKVELVKFQNRLVEQGILVKDILATIRFLLVNVATSEYYVVSANISKCAMPKEITRYEMTRDERGSKKKVLEAQKITK